MKKLSVFILALAASCAFTMTAKAQDQTLGYVNFKSCVEKSKRGQQDRENFDSIKKQMSETLEKTDKELAEIATNLEDQDYMDGLSPAAEEELKGQYQALNQELMRYQNQYYQTLNQANMRMLQSLHDYVAKAAEQIREEKQLSLILSEDSTFAFSRSLDCTDEVISIMDSQLEQATIDEIASGDNDS